MRWVKSLWILLANTKKKITIGVIYAPQEKVTPNNKLKLMYEDIREQIKKKNKRETTNTNSRRL